MLSVSLIVMLGLSQSLGVPMYGPYPPMYGMMKPGMMHGGMHSMHDSDDDLLLNCLAVRESAPGVVSSALAVNVEEKSSMSHHGMMGHGMMGKMGYGMMGKMGYGMMGGKMGMDSGKTLEADVSLVSNVASGTGFVVFTERADPAGGCTAANFGDVLVADMMSGKGHKIGGMYNPMMKMGMGYGNFAYGMGGYGLMGAGYGMGMGMGHKMGGMYGHHNMMSSHDSDRGIVTELTITSGMPTTANVDNIGFHSLKDLAGRGVAVCSEVTYDSNWVPSCKEPYFACCALKYDNKKAALS